MARAHIYSAIEDWPHALKAVNQGLEQDPENARALKLRADVLSWSGRHAEAVAAYASYLERSPADRDARRQQARIAGWSGSFRTATAFYSKLRIDFADDKVIQAEAAAKIAYFGGRWTDAVEAYKRLVALEPSNSEARFELAESQRAAHRTSDARQTLNRLAADSQHRLATAALQRDAFISAPSVTGGTDYVSSVGYAGRRLLDLQRASAGLTFGSSATAFRVSARTGGLRVTSGDAEQQSGFAGLEVEAKTGTLSFDGRTEVSRLSATQTEFLASVGWTPGDRWTLGGGVQRMALRENMTTVDQNLSGTGPFVRVQFDSPLAFVEIWSGWQELSDSNTRQQTTVVVSRALSEQRKGLRMVMWAERLSFGYQTADYYSPSGQNRIDAGLQYEHVLFKPRFRSDRRKTITTGYMIGTDNDGVLYQHPLIALDVEFANGLVLYGRAELIRSSVYRDNRFSVNLRLQDAFRQSKK
jgi:thioredoxin-like negative regulator of GroEL